jgi:hydrogenase/urease accessory protein HupE
VFFISASLSHIHPSVVEFGSVLVMGAAIACSFEMAAGAGSSRLHQTSYGSGLPTTTTNKPPQNLVVFVFSGFAQKRQFPVHILQLLERAVG